MRLAAFIDGSFGKIIQEQTAVLRRESTQAIQNAGNQLKATLRSDTESAGLGRGVANAWRQENYPKGRDSLNAAVLVYSKAPNIHAAFSQGVVIRATNGQFLAIPTPAAPKKIQGKRTTPDLYRQFIGPLRLIKRPGKLALLVADNQRARTGKRGGWARASDNAVAKGRGVATVVIFILVPQVSLKKRINLDTAASAAENSIITALSRPIGQ